MEEQNKIKNTFYFYFLSVLTYTKQLFDAQQYIVCIIVLTSNLRSLRKQKKKKQWFNLTPPEDEIQHSILDWGLSL